MKTIVKLDELLVKERKTDAQRSEGALQEVKLLMAGDEAQDMNIMRHLASNSDLVANERALGVVLELEKLEEKYGSVFTLDQINRLAVNYSLRMLRSTSYLGKMDVQCVAKVKEFAKDTCTSIDEHTLGSQFYILAPVESFRTDKVSTAYERRRDREEAREEARERRRALLAADPILFYRIDDQHFRMIHKWGTDFSVTRRIKGFKWKNSDNHFLFNFCLALVLTSALLTWARVSHHITSFGAGWYWGVGCVLAVAVAGFLASATQWNLTDKNGRPYPECFGETNWRSNTVRV